MTATIFQLAQSRGGVPKLPIDEAIVGPVGIVTDKQKHKKIHGGPDRALCLFSLDVIEALQAEGHPISPGSTGENVTIRGLPWTELMAGKRLALGPEVIVELTRITTPCKQIAASFIDRNFNRIGGAEHARWYSRVVREGVLRVGMLVEILHEGV